MARFYAVRHLPDGKLLVQRHAGAGMKYVPAAQGPGDVDHLQHLVAFKTQEAASGFIRDDLRRICDAEWNAVRPEHLAVVGLEVTVTETIEPSEGRDYAIREHLVIDQGNGGAYCSNCSADLTAYSEICPKCGLPLIEGNIGGYGFGGSDF